MNKWDMLRDLLSIQDRVNKLFEDSLAPDRTVQGAAGTWSPLVDMYETDTEFVVKAELPEVRQQDIDIRVRDNMLVIEGERKPRRGTSEGYHLIERAYGKFTRSFILPAPVSQDDIKATLRDGVLQITLPKKTEALPKQVEIRGA